MINFKLLVDNKSDFATLTAAAGTTLASTLPLANIQKYNNSKIARFTSYSDSTIKGNFPANQLVDIVALWRTSLTDVSTWRVKLYDAINQGGTLVYDSGDVGTIKLKTLDELDWGIEELNASTSEGAGIRRSILYPDNIVCRSFTIQMKDPTNTDSFFDVTRLYMGRSVSTKINMEYGFKNAAVDNAIQTRTTGGGLWSTPSSAFDKISFTLAQMEEKDRAKMRAAYKHAGKMLDIFISAFPDGKGYLEEDNAFAGKFTNSPEFVNDYFNNYVAEFEIEEC